ncbi:MAG: hypothetical protein IPM74_02615 [Crocinitomicaceae bacterium]|nr:hypothetical protein [Crocinitomicaceae bacterium]MBK8924808.1 hypothetical protein [Crocinitomicaceae bacterium]
MKTAILLFAMMLCCNVADAQYQDSLLPGKWELFKIMDNLSGNEVAIEKPHDDFKYTLSFSEDSVVKYNLELNKCNSEYVLPAKNQIEFLYFSSCTKICCDRDFSSYLTYDECTTYYLKNENLLVLVSEDRIFYFNRIITD